MQVLVAGLVLCFIACFILLVIAPSHRVQGGAKLRISRAGNWSSGGGLRSPSTFYNYQFVRG